MARERIAQSDIRRSVLDRAVAPNLDLSRHPLIGRRRELVELESELRSARLISLTGLGGIGKSYLAREAARRWSLTERPATWVDLATLHDITELPGALAMSTSLRGAIDFDLRGALAEQLERHPSLLVLDNLEHLRQAGSLVGWLLDHTTRLRILSTSRVRVGIPGEVEIRLQPLAVPRSPADLAHSPAAQLFMGRADRHRDLAQLAPEDAAASSGSADGSMACRWRSSWRPAGRPAEPACNPPAARERAPVPGHRRRSAPRQLRGDR